MGEEGGKGRDRPLIFPIVIEEKKAERRVPGVSSLPFSREGIGRKRESVPFPAGRGRGGKRKKEGEKKKSACR